MPDLAAEVERLRSEGVVFRNDIVSGPGGSQILAEDPSGNVVELKNLRPDGTIGEPEAADDAADAPVEESAEETPAAE